MSCMRISHFFSNMLSLPKTIHFNVHHFGLSGFVRWPVRIHHSVQIRKIGNRGSVIVHSGAKVSIGISNASLNTGSKGLLEIGDGSMLIVKNGVVSFARGCQIRLAEGARVVFEGNAGFNNDSLLFAYRSVSVGKDFNGGWSVAIMDGDGHSINNAVSASAITIGDHVWMSSCSTILKNSIIRSGSIVGRGAVVTNLDAPENSLIVGVPACIKGKRVDWT